MVRPVRHLLLGALALGCVVSACGTGPASESAESKGTSSDALSVVGPTPIGKTPPVSQCYTPRTWPYPFEKVSPAWCAISLVTDWGNFDPSIPFEAALAAQNCTYALLPGASGDKQKRSLTVTTSATGVQEKWSITVCPSSCALDNLLVSYNGALNPDRTPVDPYVATTSPGTCIAPLPAGDVYVMWDPKCPGGCQLGNHI